VQRFGKYPGGTYDTFFSTTYGPNSETETSFKLEQLPNFRKVWGIANKKKFYLKPGGIVKHTTFFRTNWVFSRDIVAMTDTQFIKGVSHGIIILATGRVAHATGNASTGTPTMAGSHLDVTLETSSYVRQFLPFEDYFLLQDNNWDQEGDPIGDATAVEPEDPKPEVGT